MGKKKNALIFLFFLAVSIFMYRKVVFEGWRYGDNVAADVFYVESNIVIEFLKHLSFLWNPYYFCGFPLFADIGHSLLSPFTLLILSLQYLFHLSNLTSANSVYFFCFPLSAFFMYL